MHIYDHFDAYANGAGGYGAASLCGSLAGAATAIGLAVPPEDAGTVAAELFKWYTSTELPTYQPEVENKTVLEKPQNFLMHITICKTDFQTSREK